MPSQSTLCETDGFTIVAVSVYGMECAEQCEATSGAIGSVHGERATGEQSFD